MSNEFHRARDSGRGTHHAASARRWSSFHVVNDGREAAIELTGELAVAGHRQLDELLNWLIRRGARRVFVQLGDVDEVDADCLATLLRARAVLRAHDGDLCADVSRDESRTVLELTGLAAERP